MLFKASAMGYWKRMIMITLIALMCLLAYMMYDMLSDYTREVLSIANLEIEITDISVIENDTRMVILLLTRNPSQSVLEIVFLRCTIYVDGAYLWSFTKDMRYSPLKASKGERTFKISANLPSRVRDAMRRAERISIEVSASVKSYYAVSVLKHASCIVNASDGISY